MRTFTDDGGRSWVATVQGRSGPDYKGRFHLQLLPEGAEALEAVELTDVRWNSARTAQRTLETMSELELRRRLRQALGRRRSTLTALAPNGAE